MPSSMKIWLQFQAIDLKINIHTYIQIICNIPSVDGCLYKQTLHFSYKYIESLELHQGGSRTKRQKRSMRPKTSIILQ